MPSPPSTIPALSTPNHISTVPAPTTGETNTTSEPFTVPGVCTDAATTTTGTSTEVDSKAAEEAIKSIDEQLAEQPKEAGVGEKREREHDDADAAPANGLGELKGAEEEAGKEAKKAKVAEAVDAGTAPVEAKAGETTEAPPAKGGAKRGRGRGGKAAKAAPAQGTRKSARGKGAAAETQGATQAVAGEAQKVEGQQAQTAMEGTLPPATEDVPQAQV
jgi:hypothetical protein